MQASASQASKPALPAEAGAGLRQQLAARRTLLLSLLAIAVAPILTVLVLRLPLINQLNYADPWFYTAYAWTPKHHFEIFGWNYFSVRFPAIFAIGVFKRIFGVRGGYVLLRYVLAVASGASIFLCVRRFASTSAALGAALLLFMQPFFSRSLLWDYTSYIEVSVGLIGIALWYWSDGRRLLWTLLPGAALSAAVFANAFFGTAVFALLVLEGIAALRLGRTAMLRYAARVAVCALSAVGVFIIGYLGYLAILGRLDPYELLRPTLEFIGESGKNSALYQQPISSWILHEPRIWTPVILSLALVAVLRRRIFDVTLEARVAQMCVGYTLLLWAYRFVAQTSDIETWWAYNTVVVAMAPAVGVLLHALMDQYGRRGRYVLIAGAVFLIAAIFVRDAPVAALDVYNELSKHEGLLLVVLAAGLAAIAALALGSGAVRWGGLGALLVIVAVFSYAPSILDGRGTTGIFVTSGKTEWTAYSAGDSFLEVLQKYDSTKHRVFLWYEGHEGYEEMTWADLPQDADTVNEVGVVEGLDHLTPLGAARLGQPTVAYVMVMAPLPQTLATARAVLKQAGFGHLVRTGVLADGGLRFALISRGGA